MEMENRLGVARDWRGEGGGAGRAGDQQGETCGDGMVWVLCLHK